MAKTLVARAAVGLWKFANNDLKQILNLDCGLDNTDRYILATSPDAQFIYWRLYLENIPSLRSLFNIRLQMTHIDNVKGQILPKLIQKLQQYEYIACTATTGCNVFYKLKPALDKLEVASNSCTCSIRTIMLQGCQSSKGLSCPGIQ